MFNRAIHHGLLAALILSVLATAGQSQEGGLAAALTGKTLTSDQGWQFSLGPGGALSGREADGTKISGSWHIKDGKFCRTLVQPAAWAGSSCRAVSMKGDTLMMTMKNGKVEKLRVK